MRRVGWFRKKGWEGFGSLGEKGGIGLKGWEGLELKDGMV